MYEWLEDYIELNKRLNYLEFDLEQSEMELERWLSGDLMNVRLQAGSLSCKLENHIAERKKEIGRLQNIIKSLHNVIDKFDSVENLILKKKYIEGKTLEVIADELGYSYGHVRRTHANIMKTLKFVDKLV